MAKPPIHADPSLVTFLRNFYSTGQLQIIYGTLTDGGIIPGMSERERAERTQAVAQILGKMPVPVKPDQTVATEPVMETNLTDSRKFPLPIARRIAHELLEQLAPHCERALIAGSIRRQKADVKDIELVVLPKTYVAGGNGLFDEGTRHYAILPAFRHTVETLGRVVKGKPDGRYMQIDLPSGIKLDLFMPKSHDYFRQFAIRTGSAEYSATRIAVSWKKKGWCGTADGLRRISDCEETKSGWKCIKPNPELPPVWPSEEAFFAWLGVKWVDPKDRT